GFALSIIYLACGGIASAEKKWKKSKRCAQVGWQGAFGGGTESGPPGKSRRCVDTGSQRQRPCWPDGNPSGAKNASAPSRGRRENLRAAQTGSFRPFGTNSSPSGDARRRSPSVLLFSFVRNIFARLGLSCQILGGMARIVATVWLHGTFQHFAHRVDDF